MENMDAQPIGEVKSSPRMEQISESKADSNGSMNGYDGRDELVSTLVGLRCVRASLEFAVLSLDFRTEFNSPKQHGHHRRT